ncbi:MAG: TRAP transporter large permease subunit, partial [Synergistaceae bacterium]|nr:TRAP transporter large permease subunit [Synergistaceae bacterium]
GFTPMEKTSWAERFRVTKKNFWGILLPFIIIGGIYSGAFTPTEAAAVGLVYSLVITLFVYKSLRLRDIPDICLRSITTSCMVAIIIAGAVLFGRVMTLLMIPQKLTEIIISNNFSVLMFIIAMNFLMIILGCVLETVSIILLTMPLVTPILHVLEIDPIWYAIVVTVNMTMALITPPVGMNLYVINGLRSDIHMSEIIKGVFPFIVIMALFLILVIAWPGMSLWLPSVMH